MPSPCAYHIAALLVTATLLSACGERTIKPLSEDGPGSRYVDAEIADAIPKKEPKSRYGNPPSYVVYGKRYYVLDSSHGYVKKGIASWYGSKFQGRRTSSGEPYDMYLMSAAHKELPLPTYVKVTNLENNRKAVVRINDRGPFHNNRLIDLSYAAATKLGIVEKGTGLVEIRTLQAEAGGPLSETRAQSPEPKPTIYIQVGAFSNRHNAELMLKRLEDYNLGQIRIQKGTRRQQVLFRVRIGPLTSVDLADHTAARLKQLGMQEYRVVID
ncbi:MAG: septal ring lytic transglycosylase RlpA family protein [Gammaproteobacteria bacterium]|nr:septal ring lytic transglycosylase RlpA family protein [Gammaproteobacteria bacterium]